MLWSESSRTGGFGFRVGVANSGTVHPSSATGRTPWGQLGEKTVSVISTALVVERQVLCRAGLVALLAEAVPVCSIGGTGALDGASQWLEAHVNTRMVTLDPSLSVGPLAEWIAALRHRFPSTKLVVVDWNNDRKSVFDALGAGAHGFIPKDVDRADMVRALMAVDSGQIYVPPFSADPPIRMPPQLEAHPDRDFKTLTERQREVLTHLATGKSNKEIARALRISECTVKVHIAATFRQLGVHNRVSAVAALQTQGTCPPIVAESQKRRA